MKTLPFKPRSLPPAVAEFFLVRPFASLMKTKFLDSTLALAFFSALLYMIGYAYDVSYLTRLHLPLTEYLPPTYLEIVRPFYLVLVKAKTHWLGFGAIGAVVAVVGILSASWPPFKHNLDRITTFLRRIPLGFYILTAAIGFITLSNWVVNFGWTSAEREIDMIAIKDYPDWTITFKDKQSIRCHYVTASDRCYAVILRDGSNTIVRTIPRDSVSKIEYDQSIY